jgi:hypothetical protein
LYPGQRLEQRRAVGAVGQSQHRAMDVQRLDRPCIHLAQAVLVLQGAHDLARSRTGAVRSDRLVAAWCAAGVCHEIRGRIVDRRNDEVLRGFGRGIRERP